MSSSEFNSAVAQAIRTPGNVTLNTCGGTIMKHYEEDYRILITINGNCKFMYYSNTVHVTFIITDDEEIFDIRNSTKLKELADYYLEVVKESEPAADYMVHVHGFLLTPVNKKLNEREFEVSMVIAANY
jgi:hypothetical protein